MKGAGPKAKQIQVRTHKPILPPPPKFPSLKSSKSRCSVRRYMRPLLCVRICLLGRVCHQDRSLFRSGLSPRIPALVLALRGHGKDSGRAIESPSGHHRLSRHHPRCHRRNGRLLSLLRGLLHVTSIGNRFLLLLMPLSHDRVHPSYAVSHQRTVLLAAPFQSPTTPNASRLLLILHTCHLITIHCTMTYYSTYL